MKQLLPVFSGRAAAATSALVALAALSSACDPGKTPSRPLASSDPHGSEPSTSTRLRLELGERRDGLLFVPRGFSQAAPAPLVVFFHGAGGDAGQAEMVFAAAERHQALVLSIDSRAATWDVIVDELGPDVAFLERALDWTFARYAVDRSRVLVAGFSDGASYALTLGLANGEVFRGVMAFSPGFSAALEPRGKPRVFVSHGKKDVVLPIDRCSRPIVRRLLHAGYDVEYREFDGPHWVPPDIIADAFAWLRM